MPSPPSKPLSYTHIATPIGRLLIAGDEHAVLHIRFERHNAPDAGWESALTRPIRETASQLDAYFARRRRSFDLPLAPEGTPFQKRVWSQLERIPFGSTVSYGELARRLGEPSASRAVGAANGANPIPIVIPCHRVVGSDGKLTGFGGGLAVKARLLELEAGQVTIPA
jgi:methylated-DNA-[protein]-cysteine S-methyltransferase